MLSEFLIGIIIGLVNFFLFFIPNFNGFNIEQNSAIESWIGYLKQANTIFPIDTLLVVLSLAIGIELIILGWRTIEWALSKIWPTGQQSLF